MRDSARSSISGRIRIWPKPWVTTNGHPQARWPAMAVVLVLWYWAFMNRRLPFSQLLYRSWHLVLAFAELEEEFGRPRSTGGQRSLPQALLVTLDWIQLGWFYDWKLARYDAAELALA